MRARPTPASSVIESIAYDEETARLCIAFRETGKYVYYGVPSDLYEAFCKAASPGTFFNAHVKDHFRCERDPERRRFGPGSGPPV